MDLFADDVETRLREIRSILVRDPDLHGSVTEVMIDALALVVLLRRAVGLQFRALSSDEQAWLLDHLPRQMGSRGGGPEGEAAYAIARASLLAHLAPRTS